MIIIFFFFNDTATTEIYTLSLHDALPISLPEACCCNVSSESRLLSSSGQILDVAASRRLTWEDRCKQLRREPTSYPGKGRSEEHTSELQSRQYLVCRLLLEKKKILHKKTP